MQSILIGLLFIVGGGAMIYFYNQLTQMFGPIRWFEKNLGDGRSAYIIFGFALIVIGVLVMFGFGGDPTDVQRGFESSGGQ